MSTDDMSVNDTPRSGSAQGPNTHGLGRRNLLLSGTTLAAASAEPP